MMQTLWDLVRGRSSPQRRPLADLSRASIAAPGSAAPPPPVVRRSMQDRYDAITRQMLGAYRVRVRRWRSSMSGIAWEVRYRDGTVSRLIEAPRPKGPMSAAVFLHEIGHHAIGFGTYTPRCLEEYHAWAFALSEMERLGVSVTPRVHKRVKDSLKYAVAKARRRGLRRVPPELVAYT